MLLHIADRYCELTFREGGRDMQGVDCWGLVRLFLLQETGLVLPSYDGCDTIESTIAHERRRFKVIESGLEQRFDVAICGEPVKVDGRWTRAPVHTGVLVDPGLVLHITKGQAPRVDPIARLKVLEIRRVLA